MSNHKLNMIVPDAEELLLSKLKSLKIFRSSRGKYQILWRQPVVTEASETIWKGPPSYDTFWEKCQNSDQRRIQNYHFFFFGGGVSYKKIYSTRQNFVHIHFWHFSVNQTFGWGVKPGNLPFWNGLDTDPHPKD